MATENANSIALVTGGRAASVSRSPVASRGTVTALLPNQTETEFFARADMQDTAIGQSKKFDPADVAKAGYSAMMNGKDHVAAPFATKITAALTSVLPASLVTAQARAD